MHVGRYNAKHPTLLHQSLVESHGGVSSTLYKRPSARPFGPLEGEISSKEQAAGLNGRLTRAGKGGC